MTNPAVPQSMQDDGFRTEIYRIQLGADATLAAKLAALTPAATIPSDLKWLMIVPETGASGNYAKAATSSASTPAIVAAWLAMQYDEASTLHVSGSGYAGVYLLH